MKKTTLAVGVLAAAILVGCVKEIDPQTNTEEITSTTAHAHPNAEEMSGKYVPNQLLVKFKRGTSETGRANALARVSARVEEHIVTGAMKHLGDHEGLFLLHTPMESLDAVGRMKGLPDIEYAEPNYIYRHIPLAEADDPYYTNTVENIWGMMGDNTTPQRAPMGSQAAEVWAAGSTGSRNVYIGIIDEGVQYTHEDLKDNIWVNPYDPKDKKDNDGNGKVDDINGWDFAGRNNSIYDGTSDDHGTHVAGTIGARGNNTKGVAGVCWYVNLITAKFLGVRGGTTANAIAAIDYMTDLKTLHGLNIVATNNSWGGGGYSQALYDAIERANNANILFVAAAGNDGANIDNSQPHYPASYSNENIISVGSLWLNGTKSSFSNYGATSVDILAPGQRIWSTTPSGYSNYSGTSMATPHVTGAVALWASIHDTDNDKMLDKPIQIGNVAYSAGTVYTPKMIKEAILFSAIPTTDSKGTNWKNYCVTGGRLDINSARQNLDNRTLTPSKYEDYQ